jgi:hypothetical protein
VLQRFDADLSIDILFDRLPLPLPMKQARGVFAEKPMIEEDIEAPTISRNVQSSGLSVGISLVVHLSLFLVLAMIFASATSNGLITLELESVDNTADLYQDEMPLVELDQPDPVVDLAQEELENTIEEQLIEAPEAAMVDWSSMETLSMVDAIGELPAEGEGVEVEKQAGGKGFFGIEATGNRIVYIIDMSPSMEYGYQVRRFDRAVNEVLTSVNQLRSDQEFLVFLFCFNMYVMDIEGPGKYCLPTDPNKEALARWLGTVRLQPGTDPREAIVAALQTNPTCCFLLSDGEFNGRRYRNNRVFDNRTTAVQLAKRHNPDYCPIHTIGLEDRGSQRDMTAIAKDSGGTYKFVPALNE